jgi:hypothetical protein
MAMIPGYDYDLFISYAHADNFMVEEQEGWVTQFVNQLKPALGMRLGASRELTVFCDSNEIRANSRLPDLLTATKKSALFLAIGSPSYVTQEWTGRELASFTEQNNDLSRIFMIEVLPLNSGEQYPSPLDESIRVEFWKMSGPRQIQIPLSLHADRDEFSTKVHTLAADIGKKLFALRLLPTPNPESPAGRTTALSGNGGPDQPGRGRKTVLLAQTTEDVDDEVDQLRSFLLQYGDEITLLPRSGYPQGGEAFKAAFRSDLTQADLFVQLLGKRVGRLPPDLPEGYTCFQANAAKSSNVALLQWRRPDLDPESVADSAYKSMLQSETVIASGLEAFKLQVLKEIRKGKEKVRPARSSTVFINADDKDLDIAKEIERDCLKNALTAILPMNGPSSEIIRKDLAENLIDCDMLIFIYGNTTQDWIRGQLRFFNKVKPKRESAPKLLAICSGPPPKPDIGINFPDAHVIDCPSGWNLEPIRKLISELSE